MLVREILLGLFRWLAGEKGRRGPLSLQGVGLPACRGEVTGMAELLNSCGLDGWDNCDAADLSHWRMMLAVVSYFTDLRN